jgi:protein involved in polysaccharide export with SLBB domain
MDSLLPGDTVAVSVYSRPDLSGDFTVRPDGTISMHIVGSIPAVGLTPAELERALSDAIGRKLKAPASVVLAITARRPVFVLGDVETPGAYPFTPGMTVLQLVAAAGGYPQFDASTSSLALRAVDETAAASAARVRLANLLAQRARLEAERDGAERLDVPEELRALVDAAEATRLISEQQRILDAQLAVEASRREAASAEARLAQEETGLLRQQSEIARQQVAEYESELARQTDLVERGFGLRSNVVELSSQLNDQKRFLLETQSFESRSRQLATGAFADLESEEREEARDVIADLSAVEASIALERAVLDQSARALALIGELGHVGASGSAPVPPRFEVLHDVAGAAEARSVGFDFRLRPGDVLNVISSTGTPSLIAPPR